MRRIKVAQFGMGHDHAREIMACVRDLPEIYEVVGVAEPNEAIYREKHTLSAYQGVPRLSVDELLNHAETEAVLVETEERSLVSAAMMCLERGKHIHLDKPGSGNQAEFEAMMRFAKSAGLTVQLGYMYRYNPAVMRAMRMIQDGQLGEIYEVDAIMNSEHPANKREWLGQFRGGIMYFLGCHMIDLVYRIMGEPEAVYPFLDSTGFENVHVPDNCKAVFRYARGTSLVSATSTEVNGYARRQLVVCGSKGSLEIRPLETHDNDRWCTLTYSTTELTQGRTWSDNHISLPPERIDGRYHEMMRAFHRQVVGTEENPYSYDYEINLHRCILRACGVELA